VLARLGLVDMPPDPAAPPGTRQASGPCPNCGGLVNFSSQPNEGVLLRLTLPCHPVELRDDTADAAGARAWIVNQRDVPAAVLKRRLQRLGWRVRHFANCADAMLRAKEMRNGEGPALVVVLESHGVTADAAAAFQTALPQAAQCVLLVAAGSPTLRGTLGHGAIDVRIEPLSPRELVEMTLRAADRGDAMPAGPVTLSPGFGDRPRVLVVDDNEVNRIVAAGLVQALGYEVSTVSDGLDAIERCKVAPPDLVLMDVNMPVLNGIDATRRIRELQRLGRIAPFGIVAATAAADADTVARCMAAGMDGCLTKPLHLALLQQELRRVIAARG